jgi:hypothetical protein
LHRRLQVLLDDERFERLAAESARRNAPVAALVREAIDAAYPSVAGRSGAAATILAAPSMEVPGPSGLRAELEELRGRRG